MAFNAEDKKVRHLFGRIVYSIPRNQRRYVWTEKNWTDLLNDIVFAMNNHPKEHFIGSIVLKEEESNSDIERYTIIDGQQRMITITLFLVAVMQYFKDKSLRPQFDGQKSYLLTTDINSNSCCKLSSDYHLSIVPIVEDVCNINSTNDTIDKLLDSNITDKKRDIQIKNAIRFFYDKLSEFTPEKVENIRNAVLNTNYVSIVAANNEDSYTIFEILNARGQILEEHELLKNFIMRYVQPSNDVDRIKQEWHETIEPLGENQKYFIKHYVAHKYAFAPSKYDSCYDKIKKEVPINEVNQLFADLQKKANFYRKIVTPSLGEGGNCTESEYYVFKFLLSNRGVLFRPILLSLMNRRNRNDITENIYNKILYFIKYYFVCYNLIGRETSNKISELVQKHATKLETDYSSESLQTFICDMVSKLPTEDEFKRHFKTLGWSHVHDYYKESATKRRAHIALQMLEEIESERNHVDNFTIEHIKPDHESRTNASIGNLIPLEESLNGRCKDMSIEQKIGIYQESNYKTARNIYSRYSSNLSAFNIETRSDLMASRIYHELTNIKDYCLNHI